MACHLLHEGGRTIARCKAEGLHDVDARGLLKAEELQVVDREGRADEPHPAGRGRFRQLSRTSEPRTCSLQREPSAKWTTMLGNGSSGVHGICPPEREHDKARGGGEGPDLGAVERLPEV